jgi:hypothetical protein
VARTGRPKIEIDEEQFEKLCGLQCTEEEIADFFNCSIDTVLRWCKETYGATFADAYKKHSSAGKISLRRNQFALSKKSATMAIWLGKQMLGQKDVHVIDNNIEVKNPYQGLTEEELRKLAGSG